MGLGDFFTERRAPQDKFFSSTFYQETQIGIASWELGYLDLINGTVEYWGQIIGKQIKS
jgi:hypothetical protein